MPRRKRTTKPPEEPNVDRRRATESDAASPSVTGRPTTAVEREYHFVASSSSSDASDVDDNSDEYNATKRSSPETYLRKLACIPEQRTPELLNDCDCVEKLLQTGDLRVDVMQNAVPHDTRETVRFEISTASLPEHATLRIGCILLTHRHPERVEDLINAYANYESDSDNDSFNPYYDSYSTKPELRMQEKVWSADHGGLFYMCHFNLSSVHSSIFSTEFKGTPHDALELFRIIGSLCNYGVLVGRASYIPNNSRCGGSIQLDLYLTTMSLPSRVADPLEGFSRPRSKKARIDGITLDLMKNLFALGYDRVDPIETTVGKWKTRIEDLYHHIAEHHKSNEDMYRHFLYGDAVEPCKNSNDGVKWCEHEMLVQHPGLVPQLHPYQRCAVRWMLYREKNIPNEREDALWSHLKSMDGESFYYNRFTGRFIGDCPIPELKPTGGVLADEMGLGKTIEVLACMLNNPKPEKCYKRQTCIHCSSDDAMVTPKVTPKSETVKIEEPENDVMEIGAPSLEGEAPNHLPRNSTPFGICCVCVDPKSKLNFGPYFACCVCKSVMHEQCSGYGDFEVHHPRCPTCAAKEVLESHATLIVAPSSIVYQWADEIEKHIQHGALKVKIYTGVAGSYIQPEVLACQDVVITTYQTLRNDLYYVLAGEGKRQLRNKRKYMIIPSPLVSIQFWRLCMDEAQMVDEQSSRTTEMALKLHATHRWCITGTPLPSGLNSTHGLLSNVSVFPYYRQAWWNTLLFAPCHNHRQFRFLFDVMATYMWRTGKKDVEDQINIPLQTDVMHLVAFGPVEQHLYLREQSRHAEWALKEVNRYSKQQTTTLAALDQRTLSKIMYPLLGLRQACCHPQLINRNPLGSRRLVTMDSLLDKLIQRTKTECAEEHRMLISDYNGAAGINLLMEKKKGAVDYYRMAVESWTSNDDLVTDTIQKIHTLQNLVEVLEDNPSGCERLASEFDLREQVECLKMGYIDKAHAAVCDSLKEYNNAVSATEESRKKVEWKEPWYCHVVDTFLRLDEKQSVDLCNKIKNELKSECSDSKSKFNQWFEDLDGVKRAVMASMLELEQERTRVVSMVTTLIQPPSQFLIEQVAKCCLRPLLDEPSARCEFCQLERLMFSYEAVLFNVKPQKINPNKTRRNDRHAEDDLDEDVTVCGGLKPESACSKTVKILQAAARQQGLEIEGKQSQLHLKYFEQLKKEFKIFRELWVALRDKVAALDEISICTTRMRLLYPGEEPSDDNVNVYHKSELPSALREFQMEQIVSANQLKNKRGHLIYLTNLTKINENDDGGNMNLCPVCLNSLGSQWAVFNCCHCVCCECASFMSKPGRQFASLSTSIKCPICRLATRRDELCYVATKNHLNKLGYDIEVKGKFSAKVDAVLRSVLAIINKEPSAKMILFSVWESVLKLMMDALTLNKVKHVCRQGGTKNVEVAIHAFKTDPSVSVLLMPLHSGNKGLNLPEATHVFLVEPTLNRSSEQQAIGRVHRIGQTRPTFVHRFIIRGTVEERINRISSLKTVDANIPTSNRDINNELTLAEVCSLFSNDLESSLR